jgi:putative Mn2+ efflux pump MntP
MNYFEIILLAIGLAMDCFTVSIASGIILKRPQWKPMLSMALLFGLFQAVMPLIGWLCTNHFRSYIESFDHWIAFLLLAFLGGKMIWESYHEDDEGGDSRSPFSLLMLLTLSVATSIDALAVGISFACLGMGAFTDILMPIIIIGIASFLFSLLGLGIGLFFGKRFDWPVERWGGIILILIGIKILCEHLLG